MSLWTLWPWRSRTTSTLYARRGGEGGEVCASWCFSRLPPHDTVWVSLSPALFFKRTSVTAPCLCPCPPCAPVSQVKRPMDLGTVRQRLESNEYVEPRDLAAHVRLVFNNAMMYNAPGYVPSCARHG